MIGEEGGQLGIGSAEGGSHGDQLVSKHCTFRELDRLGLGRELQVIPWSTKNVNLLLNSLK